MNDLTLMTAEELEAAKQRCIKDAEALHHEYNEIIREQVSRASKIRRLEPMPLPVNTDLLEPEYVAWKANGEGRK